MNVSEATVGSVTMRSGSVESNEALAALLGAEPALPATPEPAKAEPAKEPAKAETPPVETKSEEDAEKANASRFFDPETGKVYDLRTRDGRRIRELIRERAELREKLAAQPPQSVEPPAQEPATPDGKPTWEVWQAQGKTYDQFIEDLTDWKTETKLAARDATAHEVQASQAESAAFQRFAERETAAKRLHADYDAVIDQAQDARITAPMRDVILHHADGAELRYFFAQHPETCQRIAALPAPEAFVELGLVLASLSKSSPSETKQVDKPASPAPPRSGAPPPPPAATSSASVAETPFESLSVRDAAARLRAEETAARRRRVGLA